MPYEYANGRRKMIEMSERAEKIAEEAEVLLRDNTFGASSTRISAAVGATPRQIGRALAARDNFVNVGTPNRAVWMLRSTYERINGGEK